MQEIKKLSLLLTSMYDGYGTSGAVGISYFRKYSDELEEFNFEIILQHQMSLNWHHQYVLDFILSTPFLWGSLPNDFWVGMLVRPNIRPKISGLIDEVSYFVDIEFLSRYLGIDALAYVVESSLVGEADKRNIFDYFEKMPYGLVPSVHDVEDLDGVYFADKSLLQDLQKNLCSNFGFDLVHFDENNIHEYMKNLGERIV
ncbi:hypothetical protein [Undibacterium pigrum]|uniref:Uncharacterized protein n=1 Tax=Undibacterium pigrum TaxID=401470 RepID=A0A318J941_9BURK|nr:hypothetical protein [Undibacterium pigrum]PXX44842.1 hypothetical protein DFR42_10254 [Undibacterium pigrum]